tara:strand:- start:127 stop:582 length:456 start_codon:yes stop_codon:yes gene_type:complete
MAFTPAQLADLKQVEPNIDELGIINLQNEINTAAEDVIRDLQIKWWPSYNLAVYDITRVGIGTARMNSDQLDATQWTKCTVFRALGFHIFPKLAKFDTDQDIFERKMEFYRREYERELDEEIRFGVGYDRDSSGTFSEDEQEQTVSLRLKR